MRRVLQVIFLRDEKSVKKYLATLKEHLGHSTRLERQ
jgi:hypothetical protein